MRSVVLGAGGFGREVLPALVANDIDIVALVDPDPTAITDAVRSHNLAPSATFGSDGAEWWTSDAELVVDCTPPSAHRRHAEAALGGGKNLLVAKPIAPTLSEASRMAELASTRGGSLAVIQQMRYLPAFLRLRELIGEGALGRLGLATITFNVDGMFWKPGLAWRLAMARPVLLEGSVHVFDLLRWVTGEEPRSVIAHEFNPPWSEFRGPAGLTACVDLQSGAVVRYLANWAPRGSAVVPLNSGWELEFEHGIVRIANEGVLVNDEVVLPPRDSPMSLVELNTRLVRWYVGHLAGDDRPGPTGADNLRTMAFVDAVARAAATGARVSV
jgi:predicted dehydrogenase